MFGRPESDAEAGRIRLADLLVAMGLVSEAPFLDLALDMMASAASYGRIPGTFVKH